METVTTAESIHDYEIFFSHKHDDEKVTRDIISILRHHTDGVGCFTSEDIEKGTDWRLAIAKKLTVSSFLVLVFTDPEEDWKWCLYETGFFDALSQLPSGQARRIYCLHGPSNKPPDAIRGLQSVAANVKDIEQWLKELFEKTKQAKPEFIADIEDISQEISDLFLAERKPLYSEQSITIDVRCSSLRSPDDLPDDTLIHGDGGLIEELFGTRARKLTWKAAKYRFDQFLVC